MREAVRTFLTPPQGQRTVAILRMVFWGSWLGVSLHLWLIVGHMRKDDMDAVALSALIASETALVATIGGMVVAGQVRKSNETTRSVAQTEIAKATGTTVPVKGDDA